MALEAILTLLLGSLAFVWGRRLGRMFLRRGATANNLFKGKTSVSLAFLGLYMGLIALALYVPQFQGLPLEWRISGMRITWTVLRIILLGFCGLAFQVSWRTAKPQIFAVVLLGVLGLSGFTATESYFLAPIYMLLENNLRPNGVFYQTSDSSCAPAALATVLRRWGLNATESSVAQLAGTSRLGTSMAQLIGAAQLLGLDGLELSPTWEQMQQMNRPGVLATWLYSDSGKAPHAIALLGLNKDVATIADPAFGEIFYLPRSVFYKAWRGEYVPIYRSTDLSPTPAQTADYLTQLGFLPAPTLNAGQLKAAIRQFQTKMGVAATGELTAETALLLTGPFVTGSPRLDRSSSSS